MTTRILKTRLSAGRYAFTAQVRDGSPLFRTTRAVVAKLGAEWTINGAGFEGVSVRSLKEAEAILRIDLIADANRLPNHRA
jgi:hypothetical protein